MRSKLISIAVEWWRAAGSYLSRRPAQILGMFIGVIILVGFLANSLEQNSDISSIEKAL